MEEIIIIDEMMGRGKTTAACRYMSAESGKKRFVYVTPFLDEVDRVCDYCKFDSPNGDDNTKLTSFKRMLYSGKNIVTTHALFSLIDDDARAIIRDKGYSLIVDEEPNTVNVMKLSSCDVDAVTKIYMTEDENGQLHWIDEGYEGRYHDVMSAASRGLAFHSGVDIICVLNPETLLSFENVIMMTYLFEGQIQRAYLDFFGIKYRVCGIGEDGNFDFSGKVEHKPSVDYKKLIHLIVDDKYLSVGNGRNDLSKNWFCKRTRSNDAVTKLRNNLRNLVYGYGDTQSNRLLWTCFKDHAKKLYGEKNRFSTSFLQISSRATNAYRDRDIVAYFANRFVDPNIVRFFAQKDVQLDQDKYALGEMLQFIWRSAIRDNKEIFLYIPSYRMRMMLIDWVKKISARSDDQEYDEAWPYV